MRKVRETLLGLRRRRIHMKASISMNARTKPTSGETTIGISTLSTIVAQCTRAPAASAEPTSPPIRACDDDDGSPNHQVIRFHAIAPSSPHRTMTSPSTTENPSVLIVSLTVWATFWPSSAPTKFMTAASVSATRGVKARVETDVAIALAASWKPLV